RLPGKVLADLSGRPLLEQLIRRVRGASRVNSICVATTRLTEDDAIAHLCQRLGIAVARGDTDHVLGRFLKAARSYAAGTIVRLTADNPLVDAETIDRVVDAFNAGPRTQYARTNPSTYPIGLTVEVVSQAALAHSAVATQDPWDREHVTQYVQRHSD